MILLRVVRNMEADNRVLNNYLLSFEDTPLSTSLIVGMRRQMVVYGWFTTKIMTKY